MSWGEVILSILLFSGWAFVICLPFIQPGAPEYDGRFDEEFYKEADEAYLKRQRVDKDAL